MWLLLAFIAVPLIEIGLFIQVGGWLGTWPTLLIVLLTAVLGTVLVRSQGSRALADVKGSFTNLSDPTAPLAHGAMILFSGALLLTPGFFTDAFGFALLIPAVRTAIYTHVKSRVKVIDFGEGQAPGGHPRRDHRSGPDDQVIDGEFEDLSSPRRPSDKPSGWTQH